MRPMDLIAKLAFLRAARMRQVRDVIRRVDKTRYVFTLATLSLAFENSRPSSLPGRVAFRATRAEGEEGRLFSQAALSPPLA